MKVLNRATANVAAPHTERILQFGGGNFLRAFADWMIDVYNDKMDADLGILLVSPISKDNYLTWQDQEGLYHVHTRGLSNGEVIDECHLVKSISRVLHINPDWKEYMKSAENPDMRFIISNTTEAGIRYSAKDRKTDLPPVEFPAKLTLWLYHRYQHFNGAKEAGMILIPVELILKNGEALKNCILQNAENWGLEEGFTTWVNESNIFCNTLVDRIVPGIARDKIEAEKEKLGYNDTMMTQGEVFHFWVIEGPVQVEKELPLDKAGLNVLFTENLTPYRIRKVRILNGAHTSMVPVGYLYGIETVREAVEDETMGAFIDKCIFEEIIPTLDLPKEELLAFANDVLDRFRNPFIHHQLISISLNSTSKFNTRVLPSILEYQKRRGKLPNALVFSMAALIHFYKGERDGQVIPLKDDAKAISYLQNLWTDCDGTLEAFQSMAQQVLAWNSKWGTDLNSIPMLKEKLSNYLFIIENEGVQKGIISVI